MMPKAWRMLISPALTKPMEATMTALEDCINAVIKHLDTIPVKGALLNSGYNFLKDVPATNFTPYFIIPIANKNRPKPSKILPINVIVCIQNFNMTLLC